MILIIFVQEPKRCEFKNVLERILVIILNTDFNIALVKFLSLSEIF